MNSTREKREDVGNADHDGGHSPCARLLVGLIILISGVIGLAFRILDEEKMLKQELDGYSEYTKKVRYRLVSYVW